MKDFHYKFGIHSNIPECCARFFQSKVDAGIEDIASTFRPEYLDIDKYLHIRYVLCNDCARKEKQGTLQINILHICHLEPNDECKNFI
jgi:hypothetical protein